MQGLTWPIVVTTQAGLMQANWLLFSAVGAAVALIVWGLILFAAFRFRRTKTNFDTLPKQFRANNPLEIAWTVVPLAIVCVLFFQTYHAEAGVEAVRANPDLIVQVNGFRWGWTFAYPHGPVISGTAEHPPQLVLPSNHSTRIVLSSSDVNHSFWVPAFLFKRDAIPGMINNFDLYPTQTGTFAGHCAELCGFDHALMGFSVKVVPAGEFARWQQQSRL